MSASLVIRADASPQIGTGHVMRCLALAQAWQDQHGNVTFVCAQLGEALHSRLTKEGMCVEAVDAPAGSEADAEQLIALARQNKAAVVVVDGYDFGDRYQLQLKEAGLAVLFVDDNGHASRYDADWILNQNIHAQESLYPNRAPYTRLLLGTDYALLRREFWSWRGQKREIAAKADRILVTMGGSDPDNITAKILESLTPLLTDTAVRIKTIVGGSNPHLALLQAIAEQAPGQIELLQNVQDMPAMMAWAELAISAGGSTLWELALMGVPTCAVIIAENQRNSVEAFTAIGALEMLSLGEVSATIEALRDDRLKRTALAERSQQMVDGYGVERVVMRLRKDALWLRTAHLHDARLIWEWANEPATREASFHSAAIPWEKHVEWFNAKLADPNVRLLIGFDAAEMPIGQVRFDISDQDATISVMVTSTQAKQGHGTKLIDLGVKRIFDTTPVKTIHAYIKVENRASIRAFSKAGFAKAGDSSINDHPAYLYTRVK